MLHFLLRACSQSTSTGDPDSLNLFPFSDASKGHCSTTWNYSSQEVFCSTYQGATTPRKVSSRVFTAIPSPRIRKINSLLKKVKNRRKAKNTHKVPEEINSNKCEVPRGINIAVSKPLATMLTASISSLSRPHELG